ncbi:hypothetical protein [Bowmanella dokdonensis]|uniref:Uncharacterized protein n=1 Tax=Bowmanella dokdonensis TaxID=751969 RepID=A0A939DQX9_9ALTE|nr:hypothetical protein [Bowmanella dokdonensis]MBN7827359.1 hypothetical protein [Bowmanella dokdonensis]
MAHQHKRLQENQFKPSKALRKAQALAASHMPYPEKLKELDKLAASAPVEEQNAFDELFAELEEETLMRG